MTGTNDKLRSLFLTLLMVTSVFAGTIAFAGTAAAANTDPGLSDAQERQNGDGDVVLNFNQSVVQENGDDLNASNFNVYVRQAGTGDFVEYNGTTNGTYISENDNVESLSNGDVTYDNPSTVVLQGDSTWGDLNPADEVKVDVGNGSSIYSEISGSVESGVEIGNVTVETAAYELSQSTGNLNRSDAARIYQGTAISFLAQDDDTEILLRNVETGEIVLDGSTGQYSNSIIFNSEDLESGSTYRLIFEETGTNTVSKYFNVTSLRMSASLDEDGTMFEHNEDAEITVSGDSIRGGQPVAITVEGNSTQYERISWNNRGEFEETFNYGTDLDAGDYEVTVTDVLTGAEVSAGEFSVDSFPSADSASFGGGVFEEERGDVVEIPVNLDDSEEGAQATVSIGTLSETNYVTNVTVADEDGDGEVVVEWNTYMSGTGERDHIFSAEGDDNVTAWGGESGSFVDAVR
ncbi:DUF7827 domain-containing protein, partial [Halosimplex sp. J119]